jgi:hypothetical protein
VLSTRGLDVHAWQDDSVSRRFQFHDDLLADVDAGKIKVQ